MSGCSNVVAEDAPVIKGDREIWALGSLCRMEKEEHICGEGVKKCGFVQAQAE